MSEVTRWSDAAIRAAHEGRWQDAEQAWGRVLALDPGHPQALFSVGVHAFQRGNLDEARRMFQAAATIAPQDPNVHLALARVLQHTGEAAAELRAIEASLVADPYFVPGLLGKGEWLQRSGKPSDAVAVFRNLLKILPDSRQWPAALHARLQQAAALVDSHGQQLAAWFEQQTGVAQSRLDDCQKQRWHEAGAILAGHTQPYPSVCNQLHVPRLPAIPFFARELFDWVAVVEAQTDAIISELHAVLAGQQTDFQPYVAYPAGAPVNQWAELNHSQRWSGYKLVDNGVPQHEHLACCPATAQALQAASQPDIPGMCPNAMFSALAPHTHIPPHTGDTNARLVVHLPLIVPDRCSYRVGFEHRKWNVGEVLIFDDSIEHEARNDSDQLRVILLFDVWNPLLSLQERDIVRVLTIAHREFEYRP